MCTRFRTIQKWGGWGQRLIIPVVAHNAKVFDNHLILLKLSLAFVDKHKVSVIASMAEKFIAFEIGNLRFLDSFQFLSCSLDTLGHNWLTCGAKNFVELRKHFPAEREFSLLCKKGIFPYEYNSSRQVLTHKELPLSNRFIPL